MRRAYRQPIAATDVAGPMGFYHDARADSGFDAGIAAAVSAVLTNPEFLFRVESDPQKLAASGVYQINALELASRLSFFLWSSIPDDELLDAAVRGGLSLPGELEKQARRMLADRRSFNLATNFAGQWLRLRNIDAVNPNASVSGLRRQPPAGLPAGDRALLRQRAARGSQRAHVHPGRTTFLNERLAAPATFNVYGSRFRRVTLTRQPSWRPAAARAACCRRRLSTGRRRYFADLVLSNISARRRRLPLQTCRRSTRATWRPICRCVSAWPHIVATPCARAVTRLTRWASHSRTSMR